MKAYDKYNQQARDWLISDFETFRKRITGTNDSTVLDLRQTALRAFRELGFPHTKVEEWKYTNLEPLLRQHFTLTRDFRTPGHEAIEPFLFPEADSLRLVFVNGTFSPELSTVPKLPEGAIITGLSHALRNFPDLVKQYLTAGVDYRKQTFPALNLAFQEDGYFIYLPEETDLESPIHLLYVFDPGDVAFHVHPRNILVVRSGSRIQLLETHRYLSDYPYFHNSLTTTFIDQASQVEHIRLQDAGQQAFLINHTEVFQKSGSNYRSVTIDLGGRLVRNNLNVHLQGEEAETVLNGFYLTRGEQHVDNHTVIEHEVPRCQSNELYKGILTDKSRAVFSGLIRVHKDAQKTNAFQSNRNLLLSREAEVDTKPQLIIYADDVKCSHGATVGQMNEEAVFYMQQRGIAEQEARALLRFAFGAEVLQPISRQELRNRLEELMAQRLRKVNTQIME